jgi:hypothetical protein
MFLLYDCRAKQHLQIAPQMVEALMRRVGTLLRLGKDESTLQDGLNEITYTFRAPLGSRRIEFLGRLNVAG